MKKNTTPKKLPLIKESIRELERLDVDVVVGGQRARWYTAGSGQAVCCA